MVTISKTGRTATDIGRPLHACLCVCVNDKGWLNGRVFLFLDRDGVGMDDGGKGEDWL